MIPCNQCGEPIRLMRSAGYCPGHGLQVYYHEAARPAPHAWEPTNDPRVSRCRKCDLRKLGNLHFLPSHEDAVKRDLGPALLRQPRPDCVDIYERVHIGFPVLGPLNPKES